MPDCEKSDLAKLRNAVAVAEEGRDGEVRYLGEIETAEAATRVAATGRAGLPASIGWSTASLAPRL
jgi:hypothetical protein